MKRVIIVQELILEIDHENVKVISSNAYLKPEGENSNLSLRRTLQISEIKYGILTLGSKTTIGRLLPMEQDIVLTYNGKQYSGRTHRATQGRIDRLSALIKNFNVGDVVNIEYDHSQKSIQISKHAEV